MDSSLPILTFHSLDDRRSVISFAPEVFRRGMARLHERGYRTLSLLEAVDLLRQKKLIPDRSVVITFDDGYKTVYAEAFPVLQHYGMKATVFLTMGEREKVESIGRLPSFNGRYNMLTWHEIREMQSSGIDFGAHTLTHPDLTRLSFDRVEAEICDSKAILENMLGTPVECFAYPYGRYDNRSREIVRQHFTCACSDKLGLITPDSDPYALERVDAAYLRTDRLFDMMLTRLFPWYVWARSIPSRIRLAIQLNSASR
jgi:peptidoglycan/xylan/chitin deacetylase (PgdA/CDA1 family)